MQKNMDTIQFENRSEISEVMEGIEKYLNKYPKEDNKPIQRLYDLLDGMLMEW